MAKTGARFESNWVMDAISRRGFLGALAASFVADPERLLFVPGKKLISIPAPIIYHRQPITREVLMILRPRFIGPEADFSEKLFHDWLKSA